MEYVPGIKINDIQEIEKAGIDRFCVVKFVLVYVIVRPQETSSKAERRVLPNPIMSPRFLPLRPASR
jgi:hypothetical protein